MDNTKSEYEGVTAEEFAALQVEAGNQSGLNFAGNAGTATGDHITVAWNYDPATLELSIECVKKPFFVSEKQVSDHFDSLVSAVEPAKAQRR